MFSVQWLGYIPLKYEETPPHILFKNPINSKELEPNPKYSRFIHAPFNWESRSPRYTSRTKTQPLSLKGF